jgi:hypothetical protein
MLLYALYVGKLLIHREGQQLDYTGAMRERFHLSTHKLKSLFRYGEFWLHKGMATVHSAIASLTLTVGNGALLPSRPAKSSPPKPRQVKRASSIYGELL